MRQCKTCGEAFTPGPGKPGLIHECWNCGEVSEQERGVRLVRAPTYRPASQMLGMGNTHFGHLNHNAPRGATSSDFWESLDTQPED